MLQILKGSEKVYGGEPLPTLKEDDVFKLLNLEYRKPEERDFQSAKCIVIIMYAFYFKDNYLLAYYLSLQLILNKTFKIKKLFWTLSYLNYGI